MDGEEKQHRPEAPGVTFSARERVVLSLVAAVVAGALLSVVVLVGWWLLSGDAPDPCKSNPEPCREYEIQKYVDEQRRIDDAVDYWTDQFP